MKGILERWICMKINILQLIDGAKQAKGLTVIIDVFRAFTVEAYLMNNNAKTIIPVADKKLACRLKEENPEYILIGERGGAMLPGFDYGNSPFQIKERDFSGKTIVHTTSAGTQGFENAKNSTELLTGSLVNAKAIATYIKKQNPSEVSLVCMGLDAIYETEEDTFCAEYIKAMIMGESYGIEQKIESLKYTAGAKFFDDKLKEIFPKEDFFLSTEVNIFNFVLKLKNVSDLSYIEKIDV